MQQKVSPGLSWIKSYNRVLNWKEQNKFGYKHKKLMGGFDISETKFIKLI